MRERAISAAILVPVLLVVLALGGAVLALAIAIITAIASLELFRLLRAAGHDSFPALGTVLALTVVLDAAFPDVLDGSGLLLSAIGIVLIAVAAFTRQDPRDGLVAWIATVFGAFYVSLTAFVIRLGTWHLPCRTARRSSSSAENAAGSCSCSSPSGRTTREPCSSASSSATGNS
jgi:CDP-diglyceride synthetase